MFHVPEAPFDGHVKVPLPVTLVLDRTSMPLKLQETPEVTSTPNEIWPVADIVPVPLPGLLIVRVPSLAVAAIEPDIVLPFRVPLNVPV